MSERYVALGDSYTIGEGVEPDERWPNRLVAHLREAGVTIDLVANPSVTGWTAAQLIEHALPVLEESDPTFITLLIGVNDWVQDVPEHRFRERFGAILDRIRTCLPDPRKVVAITIPDFSITPEGATYGRGRDISAGIASFNTIILEESARHDIRTVDIFPQSQALDDRQFVAAEGLHPSGNAYARWAELIGPVASQVLNKEMAD